MQNTTKHQRMSADEDDEDEAEERFWQAPSATLHINDYVCQEK